jgi:hypothetical protein
MSPIIAALFASLALAGADPNASAWREAMSKYDQLDYEGALLEFEALAQLAADTGDDQERARSLAMCGVTRALLGDEKGARAQFGEAVALQPDLALPVQTSPKIEALFLKVREDAARARSVPRVIEERPRTEGPSADAQGVNPVLFVAAGAGVLGGASAVGAVVFLAIAQGHMATANDPDSSQLATAEAVARANESIAASAVLGASAVLFLGAAVVVAWVALE